MSERSDTLFPRLVSDLKRQGLTEENLMQCSKSLLSAMSLKEKVAQMSGSANLIDFMVMGIRYNLRVYKAGANKRLGIPPFKFTDGPRGVALGNSTCFPVSSARGATWDPVLEERVGEVIGIEARAQGADLFGGVCINLLRHPGWGRAQETYGDDPYLLGEMGKAAVIGTGRHVMTCIKHFACNSIEESRFYVNVEIDERALREVYLPHFKKCVDAGADSVMSAYNRVNGEFCGHNRHLLTDILKKDWGFSGVVLSDFVWGVYDGKAAAKAGLDLEMPHKKCYGKKLIKLLGQGEVSETVIDEAVLRLLGKKLAYAAQKRPGPYAKDMVVCDDHTRLAYEVACKSMVLLKNKNQFLPLDKQKLKKIAVLGKLAKQANLGDRGSSRVRPPYAVTPLQGIQDRAGADVEIVYYSGADPAKAARIADSADAVIVVAGLTKKEEGEYIPIPRPIGGDRMKLGLPGKDKQLIQAVGRQDTPGVVALVGSSAITMESWKDQVDAILMAWYPGMEGGNALADILFGQVNPSGKLPMAFCKSEKQLYPFDKKAKKANYDAYHGYRYFDREKLFPAFPFGFGLSYTDFAYARLRLDKNRVRLDGNPEKTLTASVDITNAGERAGDEVVQLYVGYCGEVSRPGRELKAFAKVSLEPGKTTTVRLEVRLKDLAYYNSDQQAWDVERCEYIVWVGPSSDPEQLTLSEKFTVI